MISSVVGWISVALAVIAAFLDASMAQWLLLILLLLGLIYGFMNPLEDVGTRVAFYVLAFALPTIANNLDHIPQVGTYLNAILDNFAVAIGGMAIAAFLLAVWSRLTVSE